MEEMTGLCVGDDHHHAYVCGNVLAVRVGVNGYDLRSASTKPQIRAGAATAICANQGFHEVRKMK